MITIIIALCNKYLNAEIDTGLYGVSVVVDSMVIGVPLMIFLLRLIH